jgi:hypothetical protein
MCLPRGERNRRKFLECSAWTTDAMKVAIYGVQKWYIYFVLMPLVIPPFVFGEIKPTRELN